MSSAYAHLLSPGRIGSLDLPNRLIVTAMGVVLSEADGQCGERLIAYHEEQAKGGVGLIITGVTSVAWPTGAVQPNQTAISDDRFLPGLTELVERVHQQGAKIAAQLHHGGLNAYYSAGEFDVPLWGPCYPPQQTGDFATYFLPAEMAAFAPKSMPKFKVMDEDDIATVIAQYASAAGRAKRAGFDAIEIHAAHGYLLSSFISPKTNSRTDDYGGSIDNRLRLLKQVIAAIKAEVGYDFPVWCKLDAWEVGKEGGITLDDAIEAARQVEAAGVNAITVSSYHNSAVGRLHSASNIPHEPQTNIPAATAIKAAVNLPIIALGRVELEDAEAHIAAGQYDFLAMGRKVLADPSLPRKLAEGRADQIRPCVYCYTCVSAVYVSEPVRCAVNPRTGSEALCPARTSGAAKSYVVIGGGPGGMEAACQLAEAGHQVTLFEASSQLGGTLRFASLAYPANERLLNWLRARVARSKVEVRLGKAVSPEEVAALNPEAVIVATGGRRDLPAIEGHDLPHVFSGDDMRHLMLGQSSPDLKRKTSGLTRLATRIGAATGLTHDLGFVRKISHAWMPLGRKVVIIGGELVGIELAEFLHERGREVTVIEPSPHLGKGLMLIRRARILSELKAHDVPMHKGASDLSITASEVRFTDGAGEAQTVQADHVIVAMGATGDTRLADEIAAKGLRVHVVGDANGIGYIEGAIHSAQKTVDSLLA